MAPTTPANHDPALCHPAPAAPASQASQALPQNITPGDLPALQLDQQQIMNLLRSLPDVFTKVSEIAGFLFPSPVIDQH
jgi:bHLH factor